MTSFVSSTQLPAPDAARFESPSTRSRPESGVTARRAPGAARATRSHDLRATRSRQFSGLKPEAGRRAATLLVPRDVELFRWQYQYVKRLLDVSLCTLLLLPTLLLMAVCAVAVWLDDGRPIFFIQPRTGRGARRFKMYKFRTMVTNAEAIKQQYWHLNTMSGPEFKLTNDPRVTRVGRWLRRYSLDELPQIFNVLRGNMSLVGPRPTSFDAAKYALSQTERLEVLPGITGLAQVSGRSELTFEQKLRRDLEYVERRSLRLDLWILLRTVAVLVSPRGAY